MEDSPFPHFPMLLTICVYYSSPAHRSSASTIHLRHCT